MEMEELAKLLIAVLVLVFLVWAAIFLLKGKGGVILDSIKDLLRFGR